MKILLILPKTIQTQKQNFSRCALFHMETTVSLKYFDNDCLWKHFLASKMPQNASNLISLKKLVTLSHFTRL